MHNRNPWLLVILLVITMPAFASEWTFTLRPAETMDQLAERCCGDATLGDQISKFNNIDQRVGPPAGARLRIPVPLLRRQPLAATLVYAVGVVTDGNGLPLQSGASLSMGQKLQTGSGGLALVRFADDSTLQLGNDAEVAFDTLSAYGDTGMVDTLVHLQRGRVELRVIKQAGNRLRIETPSGIAAVRGTTFRVAVEPMIANQLSGPSRGLVETTTGLVGFSQPATLANETSVEAGYGLVASANGVAKEALLQAPGPVAVPAVATAKDQLRWPKLQGAQRYQVQVGQDVAGKMQWRTSVKTNKRAFPLQGLPFGDYQVRVRGIAASGLHGMDATVPVSVTEPEPRENRWWLLGLLTVPLLLI